MRKLISIIGLVVLLLSSLGGVAFAQDSTEPFCGDLSAEDCDLLQSADTAMKEVTEGTFTLDLSLEGTGEAAIPPVTLSLAGAYATNPDMMPNAETMAGGAAMTQEQSIELLSDIFNAISADVTVTLTLPPMLMGPEAPSSISFDSRFVDGTGYINLDDLSALLQGEDAPAGWHGMNVIEAIDSLMAMSAGMEGEAGDGDTSATMPDTTEATTEVVEAFQENAGEYLSLARLDDETVNGVDVAVFETSVDLAAAFNSEELQNVLREQVRAQTATTDMSEEQVNEILQQQIAIFENTEPLVVRQTVGLEDNYIYSVDFDWTLNLPSDMTGSDTDSSISMAFSLTYNDFNNAPNIAAPDNATLHSMMELFGALGGGMGGGF